MTQVLQPRLYLIVLAGGQSTRARRTPWTDSTASSTSCSSCGPKGQPREVRVIWTAASPPSLTLSPFRLLKAPIAR